MKFVILSNIGDYIGSPGVREFLENWPALRMQSQVFAEFHRITNVNLRNQFYCELDRYTPKLVALYQQKSSRTGKGAEALREMLRIYDLEEEHDINMRRTLALRGLAVYLREDDTEFYKTCNRGAVGEPGVRGAEGRKGADGHHGNKVIRGLPGQDGWPGQPGVPGYPGKLGKSPSEEQLMKLCAKVIQAQFPQLLQLMSPSGGCQCEGVAGPPGTQGPPGLEGGRGAPGHPGQDGPRGYSGMPGHRGPQGTKGEAGPIGMKGTKGEGNVGLPGQPGPAGVQGPRGQDGEGSQGPPGEPGKPGGHGVPGKRGPPGAQGVCDMASCYQAYGRLQEEHYSKGPYY